MLDPEPFEMNPKIRRLYKNFIHLARDHPEGLQKARDRLKAAFQNTQVKTQEDLREALVQG